MKKTTLAVIVSILLLSTVNAWAETPTAPLSTPELKQAIGVGKKSTVVFFLNPMGGPCKAQNAILTQLQKDKANSFNIVYVSALQPENQKAFYDYGVRNLPTVCLVDKKGKIATMFPPGIQSYETIAASLEQLK
jgi:thiol-disulfide isomerase/thioredoxin